MNCAQVQLELIGFHFGEVTPEVREGVETHLLTCRECLHDYLDIKRKIETTAREDAPSPELRSKLRRSVARQVQGPAARAWNWWERPVAVMVASAAMVAALTMLYGVATGPGRRPRSLEAVAELSTP